jgi:hypothetical protein
MDPDSDPDLDPDADPSVFIIDLQDTNKKQIFSYRYYFCFIIEGSGSGSIPLPNGSGRSGSGAATLLPYFVAYSLSCFNLGLPCLVFFMQFLSVFRIRIRDSVPFGPLDPG